MPQQMPCRLCFFQKVFPSKCIRLIQSVCLLQQYLVKTHIGCVLEGKEGRATHDSECADNRGQPRKYKDRVSVILYKGISISDIIYNIRGSVDAAHQSN